MGFCRLNMTVNGVRHSFLCNNFTLKILFIVTYDDYGFLSKACTFFQVSMNVFARNTTLGSTASGSTSVLPQALVKLPLSILLYLPIPRSVFNLVVQRKRETVFVT